MVGAGLATLHMRGNPENHISQTAGGSKPAVVLAFVVMSLIIIPMMGFYLIKIVFFGAEH